MTRVKIHGIASRRAGTKITTDRVGLDQGDNHGLLAGVEEYRDSSRPMLRKIEITLEILIAIVKLRLAHILQLASGRREVPESRADR